MPNVCEDIFQVGSAFGMSLPEFIYTAGIVILERYLCGISLCFTPQPSCTSYYRPTFL